MRRATLSERLPAARPRTGAMGMRIPLVVLALAPLAAGLAVPSPLAAVERCEAWSAGGGAAATYAARAGDPVAPRDAPADALGDYKGARLRTFASTIAFPAALASTNAAHRACKAGRLRVNGDRASSARLVVAGDELSFAPAPERRTAVPEDPERADRWIFRRLALLGALVDGARHAPPLAVLYEDEDLAVVLKPSGCHSMSWTGTLKRQQLCLDDVLPFVLAPPVDAAGALPAPLPRHRLDARVAGPVVVAKTRAAHVSLGRSFEAGDVTKEYRAIVVGAAKSLTSGTVSAPLDGRPSTTAVEVLGTTPCAVDGLLTDVALFPKTGRRHQLRRHCAEALGAPILGDDLHAGGGTARKRVGLFLYCRAIAFPHPVDAGKTVACEIPEPPRYAKHRAKARSGYEWDRARVPAA